MTRFEECQVAAFSEKKLSIEFSPFKTFFTGKINQRFIEVHIKKDVMDLQILIQSRLFIKFHLKRSPWCAADFPDEWQTNPGERERERERERVSTFIMYMTSFDIIMLATSGYFYAKNFKTPEHRDIFSTKKSRKESQPNLT